MNAGILNIFLLLLFFISSCSNKGLICGNSLDSIKKVNTLDFIINSVSITDIDALISKSTNIKKSEPRIINEDTLGAIRYDFYGNFLTINYHNGSMYHYQLYLQNDSIEISILNSEISFNDKLKKFIDQIDSSYCYAVKYDNTDKVVIYFTGTNKESIQLEFLNKKFKSIELTSETINFN